jgi:hypothetical protein
MQKSEIALQISTIKKLLEILVLSLLFSSTLNTVSFSEHAEKKNKEEKEKFLQIRIVDTPSLFKKIKIAPAEKLKDLNKEIVKNKNTKKIDKIVNNNKKSLLSVLYYDGQKVIVDKKSNRINDDTKLFSMEKLQSFVSSLILFDFLSTITF